jgi:RNA recognition motif-containing protein
MTLTCSKCDEVKDVSEFHKDASISRGYAYICKACKKLLQRAAEYLEGRL